MKPLCALIILCLLFPPSLGFAQSRGRRTRRAPASTAARRTSGELAEARTRVAEQLKLLTRFLYLFGRISSGIEAAEEQARSRGVSSQAQDLTNRNKAALRQNLENVRAGLDELEFYFRTTPALERYYLRLEGVAAAAAAAEDRAAANQLDQAGRALLEVVNRLTDVLLEI